IKENKIPLTNNDLRKKLTPSFDIRFTKVYRDSYISSFLKGSEFNALLSIKLNDIESAMNIKGALLGSPLDYKNIGIYINALLESYLNYKVNAVTQDPKLATNPNRVGIYLSPLLFRQLLPVYSYLEIPTRRQMQY
ncbi:uncharacterized protein N7484_005305, partial [Penicillium longicatenatum]|uniref:uncharacterized protein n=1 Tax=Penicillium longicatenatum TaxID=1561947 RepID=UPI00254977B8